MPTTSINAIATLFGSATSVKIAAGPVNGGQPSLADIRAATADTTDPYEFPAIATLQPGEWVWLGALAYDEDGRESAPTYVRASRENAAPSPTILADLPFTFGDASTAIDSATEPLQAVTLDGGIDVLGWTITSDDGTSGDVVVKLEQASYADFPGTFAEVESGNRPTISAGTKAEHTYASAASLTGKRILKASVVSAATVTRVTVTFHLQRA